MKKLIILLYFIMLSCSSDGPNPCIIAEDFIKEDLKYPDSAEISIFDCIRENNPDGTYTILTKIKASNAFGVKSTFIYKLKLLYNSGDEFNTSSWTLLSMRSEKTNK